MAHYQIGTYFYQAGRLNALQQLHVTRRLMPVLTSAQSLGEAFFADDQGVMQMDFEKLDPIVEAFAQMKDEDVDYVIGHCLNVVTRANSPDGPWVAVWNAPAKRPMYDDIDMMTMLRIVGMVVQDVFRDFFTTAR